MSIQCSFFRQNQIFDYLHPKEKKSIKPLLLAPQNTHTHTPHIRLLAKENEISKGMNLMPQ